MKRLALWGALSWLLLAGGSALPTVAAGAATVAPGASAFQLAAPTVASASPGPSSTPLPIAAVTVHAATLRQLIGQKLVVRMSGTTPSDALIGRIQRGEIGGVVLFG